MSGDSEEWCKRRFPALMREVRRIVRAALAGDGRASLKVVGPSSARSRVTSSTEASTSADSAGEWAKAERRAGGPS